MKKLATFIVDKRNLFFLLYIFALIFSIFSSSWVEVENDITKYLAEDTETRQGLTVMNEEFTAYGTARVMVSNVTYAQAEALAEKMKVIPGISQLTFGSDEDNYHNSAALFDISFEGAELDPVSIAALNEVKALLTGYDAYIDTIVGYDASADLAAEMAVIVVAAAVIILVALVLTSNAYMEVPVLLLTFGTAALLNMGTNFLCGTISFISNSVTVVLQLALAIDYAIILCHRFSAEHETLPAREACIEALSKAIPEISSSSLTTISGLAALAFMHFRIGLDMSTVLIKAILLSLLSVFTLMPGLLMLFSPLIDKTRHRILIPNITWLGKLNIKTRFIVPPIFLAVTIAASILSTRCPYAFAYNDLETAKQNQQQIAHHKIKRTFGSSNMMAIIVPSGNYETEGKLLAAIEAEPGVGSTMGLSNIRAMDDYVLTEALTPRQFSELAGIDYEAAQLLYSAYAADQSQYGQLLTGIGSYKVPLFDMFTFLSQQMRNGNVHIEGNSQMDLDDLFDQLDLASSQLKSAHYSRLVVFLDMPEEGEATYRLVDRIHEIVREYYPDEFYMVGNTTSAMDLSASFTQDNLLISILSALFVVIILLFTFKSVGLPVLLILVIQGSIWINFAFPTLTGTPLYFLGYLIVSAVQMGANIDYAIVISSHYTELKARMEHKKAMIQALNASFPTIFTSGSILTSAGFLISALTSNPVIATMGNCLGRGTFISMLLVLAVLPQILVLGDIIVEKTSFRMRGLERPAHSAVGTMYLSGHVRGNISGFVDADISGILRGELDATVSTASVRLEEKETTPDGSEKGDGRL